MTKTDGYSTRTVPTPSIPQSAIFSTKLNINYLVFFGALWRMFILWSVAKKKKRTCLLVAKKIFWPVPITWLSLKGKKLCNSWVRINLRLVWTNVNIYVNQHEKLCESVSESLVSILFLVCSTFPLHPAILALCSIHWRKKHLREWFKGYWPIWCYFLFKKFIFYISLMPDKKKTVCH